MMAASDRFSGLLQAAFLDVAILLQVNQLFERLQISQFGTELPIRQGLADIHPLLDHRDLGVELGNRSRYRRLFRLLLPALTIKRCDLCMKFRGLVDQQLALHGNKERWRVLGRMKPGNRILVGLQCGP